jgi:hypothetical protein
MSMMLTFWEDAPIKHTEDDFDEILTIRLKSVKQIPELIAKRPRHCTMISTEHTGNHVRQKGTKPNPLNPRSFIERWRKGQKVPVSLDKRCPLCGKV